MFRFLDSSPPSYRGFYCHFWGIQLNKLWKRTSIPNETLESLVFVLWSVKTWSCALQNVFSECLLSNNLFKRINGLVNCSVVERTVIPIQRDTLLQSIRYFGAKVTLLCTNASNCMPLLRNGSAQALSSLKLQSVRARCELTIWLDRYSPNALKPMRPFLPHIQSLDKTDFEFGFTSVSLLFHNWSKRRLFLCLSVLPINWPSILKFSIHTNQWFLLFFISFTNVRKKYFYFRRNYFILFSNVFCF